MTGYGWLTLLFIAALLALSTPLLGNYMAKVYGNQAAPGDRFFLPIERFVYRVCRIDPDSEQRWRTYVLSLLVFSLFGMILTQGWSGISSSPLRWGWRSRLRSFAASSGGGATRSGTSGPTRCARPRAS
jgi:Potassium-transporting ATPase A subunit